MNHSPPSIPIVACPSAPSNSGTQEYGTLSKDLTPSPDGPDDAPEAHEVPFALVMKRAPKGSLAPEPREPPDGGAAEMSRPAPKVTLTK
jgi:hypothetical protein